MLFDEALAYLLSLGHETLTIKLGLKNTELLLAALGNPHQNFPAVQIAGTNGKGSTAVMLDSICRAAGIRVGLFTSPHLVSITERISIDGEQIAEAEFAKLTEQVKSSAERLIDEGQLEALPTFFEHVTCIALLAFRQAKVELSILETGLGGRLDSTTGAGANIVAITTVSMDHQEYLGHTLAKIAAEKAAIIRPGVTAIISPQSHDARAVILRRCDDVGVTPRWVGNYPSAVADGSVIKLGLRGRHQIPNAATAVALAEALRERGFAISSEAIVTGLGTATHPGRLELWEGRPHILFDGAHNPAAVRALRDYLDEFVKEPVTMIFGAMRDKDLKEMAAILFPAARELILTQINNPRAAALEMMKAVLPDTFEGRVQSADSIKEALQSAQEITPDDGLICVTGSLYLVGEAQQVLGETRSFAHQQSAD